MTSRIARLLALGLVSVSLVVPARAGARPSATPPAAGMHATAEKLDALPMAFEPNLGQADARVKFLARGDGYAVFLGEAEAVLSAGGVAPAGARDTQSSQRSLRQSLRQSLRLSIEGAAASAKVRAERELPGKVNHLVGERSKWLRNVPTYGAVRYESVYPGVDALFYGTKSKLEYDFEVAPGADATQIRVRFEGAKRITVDEATGDLVLELERGEMRQRRAVAFQEGAGGKRPVEVRYEVGAGGQVRLGIGDYDRTRPLTIDPVLDYQIFLGGGGSEDHLNAVAVDGSGNIFVAGHTDATDFPVTSGAFDTTHNTPFFGFDNQTDAFVTKFDSSTHAPIYSTYLGGTYFDAIDAVAIDANGNAFVAGKTWSSDFPITQGAFDSTYGSDETHPGDGFVAKLSATGGSLLYSTFLGGSGVDECRAISVTLTGAAAVVGSTNSSDFPVTAGCYDSTFNGGSSDAFALRLAPSGAALEFSTYLGGENEDVATGVAVDAGAVLYVGGYTASSNFPSTPGAYETSFGGLYDGFCAKLSQPGAALSFATFLGNSGFDAVYDLAFGPDATIVVCGRTASSTFPVTAGAVNQVGFGVGSGTAFVTRFANSGASLVYSALVGGSLDDGAVAVAMDGTGAAYVTGTTDSDDLPTTAGAFDTTKNENNDAFAFKLSPSGGSLVYSTYLGGSADDESMDVAAAPNGRAVVVGSTTSINFPVGPNAYDPRTNGLADGFVSVLDAGGSSLVAGTYLSGAASSFRNISDTITDIAVDGLGSAYVVGATEALSFPITSGAFDTTLEGTEGFVSKISADGSYLVYSTYLGGNSSDAILAVALASTGEAVVAGGTASTNFPVSAGAYDTSLDESGVIAYDGFVSKLSADGSSLIASTFVGGSHVDELEAISLGADNTIYATGFTYSTNYPVTPGAPSTGHAGGSHDAIVSKFSASLTTLLYSTYLGGGGDEIGYGIAIDSSGSAHVTGTTSSSNFPTVAAFDSSLSGERDAFVTKIGPSGTSFVYSTYHGGGAIEEGHSIALDASGRPVVVGGTNSPDFPTTEGAFDRVLNENSSNFGYDGFVTRMNESGSMPEYSTFMGGERTDTISDVTVYNDIAFVTGVTVSFRYPTTPGAIDVTLGAGPFLNSGDAFVTGVRLGDSRLAYSSYLGGEGGEAGKAISVGSDGVVFVSGAVEGSDFPAIGFGGRDNSTGFVVRLTPIYPAPYTGDSIGIFNPTTSAWFLRNHNSTGVADVTFSFGAPSPVYLPIVGDWDGDGVDTPGLYNSANGTFFLRNSSSPGQADVTFSFGAGGAGIRPLVGDWNDDGVDTVGLYVDASGVFFLRNTNASGPADVTFTFGAGGAGYVPVTGDWDGDGVTTVGIYNPATGAFFLRNTNANGGADLVFTFGGGGAVPVVGDWDGDGDETVGLYVSGVWFLRDENANGPADYTFGYGPAGVVPVVGDWDGI